MSFGAPSAWYTALLGLIPILLYLYRFRSKLQPISSLLFYRLLVQENASQAAWRRWRHWISLAVALLSLWLLSLAMADPKWRSLSSEAPQTIHIVIDLSASMQIKTEQGQTFLRQAIHEVLIALRQVPAQVPVSLMTLDQELKTLVTATTERRQIVRALQALQPVHLASKKHLVTEWMQTEDFTQVVDCWWVSDHEWSPQLVEQVSWRNFVPLQKATYLNTGITALQLQAVKGNTQQLEAFIAVSCNEISSAQSVLKVLASEQLLYQKTINWSASERQWVIPLQVQSGQTLKFILETPGDVLALDDRVEVRLPSLQPKRILWVTPQVSTFLEMAIRASLAVTQDHLVKIAPAAYTGDEQVDIYLFDSWLPPQIPSQRPVLFLQKHHASDVFESEVNTSESLWDNQHPILFRVQPLPFKKPLQGANIALSKSQTLWSLDGYKILQVREMSGQRTALFQLDIVQQSEWAMLPDFPLLIANLLHWLLEKSAYQTVPTYALGTRLSATEAVGRWLPSDAANQFQQQDVILPDTRLHLRGIWQSQSGQLYATGLLNAEETQQRWGQYTKLPSEAVIGSNWGKDWGSWSMWVMIWALLILTEFVLYHREVLR